MNLFKYFEEIVLLELEGMKLHGELSPDLALDRVSMEPPRDPAHGDLATNAALVLAKPAGKNPRALAESLAQGLRAREHVAEATVAGPGFVNLRLSHPFWHAYLGDILRAGDDYGASAVGRGRKVNVEYVSANPTGPLTIGHARGAVVGDALASLLAKAGYDVTREYYINDAGGQVDRLARSHYLRLRQQDGRHVDEAEFEGAYPGSYVRVSARAMFSDFKDRLATDYATVMPEIRKRAIENMMDLVRADLAALGVRHDVFTSERALVESGAIEAVLQGLEDRGLIYEGVLDPPKGKTPEDWEPRAQTLFRATDFDDDVDRPVRKSDGSWTYLASDMAYHLDKFRRGARLMIDVWGADHGGYVKRLQGAVQACTQGEARLSVVICQLVKLSRGGDPVKMSKRAGNFVTLREVIDEVGKDVVRFIMLTRKNDAPLEFDLAKVREQSRDNPVFYVQYAHARVCSVMRHAAAEFPGLALDGAALANGPLHLLTDSDEIGLIGRLAQWPRVVESAAEAYEPHRVAFYLYDLAAAFHALWTKGKDQTRLRFLLEDEPGLSAARLALLRGVALVIASGLNVFGIHAVEEMK